MMGMIFRTDTHEHFVGKQVEFLTREAVASKSWYPPEMVATHSWREILPTLSLLLKFTWDETAAVNELRYIKTGYDEATITPSLYGEVKNGNIRLCRHICTAVLATYPMPALNLSRI